MIFIPEDEKILLDICSKLNSKIPHIKLEKIIVDESKMQGCEACNPFVGTKLQRIVTAKVMEKIDMKMVVNVLESNSETLNMNLSEPCEEIERSNGKLKNKFRWSCWYSITDHQSGIQ